MSNKENKDMVNNLLDLIFDKGTIEEPVDSKKDLVNNLLDLIDEKNES